MPSAEEAALRREERKSPVAEIALPRPVDSVFVGDDSRHADGTPTRYVNRAVLRSLLQAGEFAALTAAAEEMQRQAEADPALEAWIFDAADAFGIPDPALAPPLDAWVAASPGSFAPLLARGAHRVALGFAERGTAWTAETHPSNFAAMRGALHGALADIDRVLEMNPGVCPAWRQKINAAKTSGPAPRVVAAALAHCPDSFQLQIAAMRAVTPSWGGSYAQMRAIAEHASSRGPRFRVLAGYIDLDKASRTGDTDAALLWIEQACARGEHWEFLNERAEKLRERADLVRARQDVERALALRPGHPDVLFTQVAITFDRKEYEAAGEQLAYALQVEPTHRSGFRLLTPAVQGLVHHARGAFDAGRRDDALRLLDIAAGLAPNDHNVQQVRAYLVAGPPPENADAEIDRLRVESAALPDDFRVHQRLDYALARERRFSEVIAVWDEYLLRNGGDGPAYLERAGAHFHLGHRDEALADARKACELGVSEGCARLKPLERVE